MNGKFLFLMGAFLLLPLFSWSQPTPSGRPFTPPVDTAALSRRLSDLTHEVKNHEVEIRVFDEKLQNQETIVDALRQQVDEHLQNQKDQMQVSLINVEGRLDTLDKTIQSVIADLKQMKGQSNDSVQVLTQYKQKLSEFEKIIEVQNQQMKNLELALNSVMEMIQTNQAVEKLSNNGSSGGQSYTVQAGDSLDKIARRFGVSVQKLMETNHLTSDRIRIGQKLQIP